MKVLLLFDRLICKIKKEYRKKLFKIKIKCEHNDFSIVGDIILINKNIRIGQGVTIYPGVMFFGDGIIEIGDNVDIGKDTIFYSSAKNGGIKIGANTMIAAQCYIIDTDHGTKRSELICQQENNSESIKIGTDCWLGANVTVTKGSTIEDGAVIGAKSLVRKGCKVSPYSISVGIPCKIIKYRY